MSVENLDQAAADAIMAAIPSIPAGIEIVTADDNGQVTSTENTVAEPKEEKLPEATTNIEETPALTEETAADPPEEELLKEPEQLPEPEELLQGNDLVAHLRKQAALRKEDSKVLREQKKRISELEEARDAPVPEAPNRIAATDVFRAMVEIRNGDRPEADLSIAREQIELMSLDELDSVMEKAENNFFGEMSTDVLEIVKANESKVRRLDRQRVKVAESTRDWKRENIKAWDEVRSIPGMEDKNSDIYSSFAQAEANLLQMFPKIKLQADAPLKVLDHMELTRRAGATTKISTLEQENARLRKQLNLGQSGLSSDGTVPQEGNTSKELTPAQQFAIDIGVE